jgi:hypothetical protein
VGLLQAIGQEISPWQKGRDLLSRISEITAMPDRGKSVTTQLQQLADRLARLERQMSAGTRKSPERNGGGQLEQFCSLPKVPERTFSPDVSEARARLIIWMDKKWVNGTKLRYYFFERGQDAGGDDQVQLVREGFKVWQDVGIGISFEEVTDIGEAEIRIGFRQGDGAWSYLGRDVVDIPGQYERTMNFGWDLTADPRGVDTPVHEIGHTLGFPHEHQNPFAGIVWDEEAVYDYFGGSPNWWPRATTEYNVLRKLPESEVQGTEWDPHSIMHYAFPAGLILQPPEYRNGLRRDPGLSERDREQVRLFYPLLAEDRYEELKPLRSETLSLGPTEQKNYVIKPTETRDYTIQTFGRSDTVMVLFEDQNDNLKYVKGDDDSGTSRNARIQVRLYQGRRYVLRIRLYFNWASGDTAVMMW